MITVEKYIKQRADKYVPLLAVMGKIPNNLANSQKFQNKQMIITAFSWYLTFQMGICGPELAAGNTLNITLRVKH
jgi:hypothetical protein